MPYEGVRNEVPEKLGATVDRVVDAIATGAPHDAADAEVVIEWLQSLGYDLTEYGSEREVWLSVTNLGPWWESDLRDALDLDEEESVTNEQRLDYAVESIREAYQDGTLDYDCHPAVFAAVLESSAGQEVLIGASTSGYSMTGVQTRVHGLFRTWDEFSEQLRREGFVSSADELTVDMILENWSD